MKWSIFFLWLGILAIGAGAQVFEVSTLQRSGPDSNRINLVILGDGYQISEMAKFEVDARKFMEGLFQVTPYREYRHYFNVSIIKSPSRESGASHPGTALDVSEPDHPVSEVDNIFGSTFDSRGIHRLLVAENITGIHKVLAENFPQYDQAFILVNSPFYGGSGGLFPVASTDASSVRVAIHELGHSFADLADEYWAGQFYAAEKINMTRQTNPDSVRWANWVGDYGVGLYPHEEAPAWHRPHDRCNMRYLGKPFCPVCVQGTIEAIQGFVSPLDGFYPQTLNLVNAGFPMKFKVQLVEPDSSTIEVAWSINGISLHKFGRFIEVFPEEFYPGHNQLTATIQDKSPLLRVDSQETLHFASVTWNIQKDGQFVAGAEDSKPGVWDFQGRWSFHSASGTLVIHYDRIEFPGFQVEISDIRGKKIFVQPIETEAGVQIPCESLGKGSYYIRLSQAGVYLGSRLFQIH